MIQSRMVVFLRKIHASSMTNTLNVAVFCGLFDLGRCPLQHIKQQRLQDVRVVRPAIEVEGLEAGEGERVLGVVEEVAELSGLRPAMQALSQRAEDGREVGERPYLGGQLVGALDRGEQRLFILGRQLIASTGLDEHPQEQVQKIQVLVGRLQRERIDGEAGVLQADIQIGPAEGACQRLVAAAEIEDEGQRIVFLRATEG